MPFSQKSSNFQEDLNNFPERLYDDIEDFLDTEGLFIISQSPILSQATLRPITSLKILRSLKVSENSDTDSSHSESDVFEAESGPIFMRRRIFLTKISQQ